MKYLKVYQGAFPISGFACKELRNPHSNLNQVKKKNKENENINYFRICMR